MVIKIKNNEYLFRKRKAVLTKLGQLCKEILIGYEESMAYGAPTYKKDKGIEIGFASQKNHICFYCLIQDVMLNNNELLKDLITVRNHMLFKS